MLLKDRPKRTPNSLLDVTAPQKMHSCVTIIINVIRHLGFINYFYYSLLLVANISFLPHLWASEGFIAFGDEQEILSFPVHDLTATRKTEMEWKES